MMTQSQARAPDTPSGAAYALYRREHDVLERLYVLRGQLDYVRARVSSKESPANDSAYRSILPRLERSYATAVRDYEQVRAARLVSGTAPRIDGPIDGAAWDRLAGGALLLTGAVLVWFVATRLARRERKV